MAYRKTTQMLFIKKRQSTREEFSIDDPLAQPGHGAKANPLGQFGKRGPHTAHIMRIKMLKAVAQHDPIHRRAIGAGAFLAQIPDELCIKAGLADAKAFRIDLPNQVQIDKAVVDRGDQRIRAGNRGARHRIIAARRVDDQKILPNA